MKFKQRNVLAVRPENVPADAIIFNAPRPIYGDKTWQGDFCSGVFYAAVYANSEDYKFCVNNNKSLDARVLNYTSEAEARAMVVEYYKSKKFSITQEQLDEYWKDCFYQHFGEVDITIEEK